MSSVAVATIDEVLDVAAASIREAAAGRHGAERRAYVRLSAAELEWLREVRLKSGPSVRLVDVSRGGALIDARVQMRPGTTITLELAGAQASLELRSHVLRCHLASMSGGVTIYRGACRFSEPIAAGDLRDAAVLPLSRAGGIRIAAAAEIAEAAWQKIVVRYRDGGMLKGYTLDFHPSREHFWLWPFVNATRSERVIVPLARLKALFFVKDFDGDPTRGPRRGLAGEPAAGRRIEVTFADGEVLRGTTLGYRPDGSGFFVVPSDTTGNNLRVFVTAGAVRQVRLP